MSHTNYFDEDTQSNKSRPEIWFIAMFYSQRNFFNIINGLLISTIHLIHRSDSFINEWIQSIFHDK